jgi:Serine carboxypeptidase S28
MVVRRRRQPSVFIRWLLVLMIDRILHYTTPTMSWAGTPAPAQFFHQQLLDHTESNSRTFWTQRYYTWEDEFQGPGHPILLILGGEGNIEPSTGLVYPFVTHHLAKDFGAFVLQPEHRFYGRSQPLKSKTTIKSGRIAMRKEEELPQMSGIDPRVRYLTPYQALCDAMRLLTYYQRRLGCSSNRSDFENYCPVITIGGSYPGWLSAMARLLFPDQVDIAYAASAPMKFYSQQLASSELYYQHITTVAEQAYPGCAYHVRTTLRMVQTILLELPNRDVTSAAVALGFCPSSVPSYIQTMTQLSEELMMIIAYTFANDNMAYYPPDNTTQLYQSCKIFASIREDPFRIVSQFLRFHFDDNSHENFQHSSKSCVRMSAQLPSGPNATISSGDWSGVGSGSSGESWDFQTCTLLVEAIGFSDITTMFPSRPWTMNWLNQHCQQRFGVTPEPYRLVKEWHFDDFVGSTNASHILFTNGLNDGWSVGAIMQNLSENLISLNFENGAHHSDLSRQGPSDRDTPDIIEGFNKIRNLLSKWLNEIQPIKYPLRKKADLTNVVS